MNLKYKAVVQILSDCFDILEDQVIAFRGRLQHLQRLGFPPGVNTGRGKPSKYGWSELVLLRVAFEYLDMGGTPDRAAAELTKHKEELLEAVCSVVNSVYLTSEHRNSRHFLKLELSALDSLKAGQSSGCGLGILSLQQVEALFAPEPGDIVEAHYAFVDLDKVITSLVDQVHKVSGADDPDTVTSIVEWSQSVDSKDILQMQATA